MSGRTLGGFAAGPYNKAAGERSEPAVINSNPVGSSAWFGDGGDSPTEGTQEGGGGDGDAPFASINRHRLQTRPLEKPTDGLTKPSV